MRSVLLLCMSYHLPELLELLTNTSYTYIITVFQESDMTYTAIEHLSLAQFSTNNFIGILYFNTFLSLIFKT
jgi:hypothetical protein